MRALGMGDGGKFRLKCFFGKHRYAERELTFFFTTKVKDIVCTRCGKWERLKIERS